MYIRWNAKASGALPRAFPEGCSPFPPFTPVVSLLDWNHRSHFYTAYSMRQQPSMHPPGARSFLGQCERRESSLETAPASVRPLAKGLQYRALVCALWEGGKGLWRARPWLNF